MSSSFVMNKQTAWLLYSEAKLWSTTPAQLVAVEDPYVAFCLNQAVGYWGLSIENAMHEVEGKNARDTAARRKLVLQQWLSDKDDDKPRGQFADPAMFFK